MLYVRVIKTKSGSRSVQVVRYENRRRVIVRHIGSGSCDEEIITLTEIALSYIHDLSGQPSLFSDNQTLYDIVGLSQLEYLGFHYTFLYDVLYSDRKSVV